MSFITSIQKYSIHDGEGIRTTVFFKGCGLKCTWCHNPETQNYGKQLSHDEEKCSGCGDCVVSCPNGAIRIEKEKAITDRKKCIACGVCGDFCNFNLREIEGREYTIDELIRELRKDEMFYDESGGGVTLSGGEVMTADMDYIEEVLKKLKRYGISVNIDTCGHAPYENYERILPYVDTFLYDIKTLNKETHKKYMGASNELILSNLEKLSQQGARIFIRIPIIKGVNGENEEINDIIYYLKEKEIRVAGVNLLPYHNIGKGKYAKIGMKYEGDEFKIPTKDEMNHYRELFLKAGFNNVKIGG